ncbi:AIR carboxylase family protein [Shigella flexneri]
MIAAKTLVPVLGVPVQSAALSGVDSLYSIVQMPAEFRLARWRLAKQAPPTPPSRRPNPRAARRRTASTSAGLA